MMGDKPHYCFGYQTLKSVNSMTETDEGATVLLIAIDNDTFFRTKWVVLTYCPFCGQKLLDDGVNNND